MGRIDVHSHLLPGVDDGSQSIDESLAIARQFVDAGYSHMVCTPHVWPTLDNNAMTIALRVGELQTALDGAGISLTLIPGGEMTFMADWVEQPIEDFVTYNLAGRFCLFDFWHHKLPAGFDACMRRLVSAGVTPILAHPERIEAIQSDPSIIDRCQDLGVRLQGNLECVGEGDSTRRGQLATKWLREKRYFLLGSDTHRVKSLDRRMLGLQRASELLDTAELDRLTERNPALVVTIS